MRRRTIVLAALVVGVALAGLVAVLSVRTEAGRRFLVAALSSGAPAAAAADVPPLDPTFDGADAARPHVAVRLMPVVTGVAQPTDVASVPGHPDRMVILGKQGTAWLASEGQPATRWFTVDVRTASELGLLGVAFHPRFQENGLFFLNTNPADGELRTVISRWRVDPATLEGPRMDGIVLELAQPYQNHNGGQLAFGPDGKLYVGTGDGGYRGDPQGNGQDRGALLGKMLRIDVDTPPYAIPPDNPFVGEPGARPEIWAYGLRNPWRFTFDPRGRLIVADVGQDRIEEIDLVERGDDLGWNVREGDACYSPAEGCRTEGLVDPIWTYPHAEGISITGGVVWTAPGPLSGRYLFADFGTGRIWALDLPETRQRVPQVTALGRFDLAPSAFGRAPDGGAWVTDFRRGAIYRVTPGS